MKKAFTLVELLVVIGILGILMGVLLGTFGGAGESARATKCMTNLRNLAMGVQAYGMEHGSYPTAIVKQKKTDDVVRGWVSWSSEGNGSYMSPYEANLEAREFSLTNGLIWTYMKGGRDCYFCPGHQRYARENHLGAAEPLWSYAMNPNVDGTYGAIDRADRMLLFAELPYAKVQNGDFSQSGRISGEELDPTIDFRKKDGSGGGNEAIGFNHKNGKTLCAHVCYVDGHVAKLLAPKAGDAIDLTSWLCQPTDKEEGDFDVSFDGTTYRKSNATE